MLLTISVWPASRQWLNDGLLHGLTFGCYPVKCGSKPDVDFISYIIFVVLQDDSTQPLVASDSVVIDAATGRVEFKSLKKSDEGSYTCTASNDVGKTSSTGSLKILGKYIRLISVARYSVINYM